MNRFLLKTSLFLLAIFLVGVGAELWIGNQLKQGKRYFFQGDWHDLANHNSEIIFLGNSRTWVQVDPFFIQNKFNTTCEVVAQDGQDVAIVWLKFKEYLKNNKAPKELYLQFDPFFLKQREDLFGLDFLRTCFFSDRVDLSSLSERNGYKTYYRFVPLAAYNWKVFDKIRKNETIDPSESFQKTHGAIIQDKKWEGDWSSPELTNIDPKQFGAQLDSIVMACKKNDIKLYAIFSPQSYPSYQKIEHLDALHQEIDRLEKWSGLDIPFIDFNNSNYNDSILFYNHMHLNRRGVDQWMQQLVETPELFVLFR